MAMLNSFKFSQKWILIRSLIMIFFLVAPFVVAEIVPLRTRYLIGSNFIRNLDYIGHETFKEGPPIDFLFMGDSSPYAGVNAKYIESGLRFILKRNDVYVENFAHNEAGVDLDFLLLKEVIKRRGVKTVILSVPDTIQLHPHRSTRLIWNPLDKDTRKPEIFFELLSEKILDSIPNFLSYVSRRFPDISAMNKRFEMSNGGFIVSRPFFDSAQGTDEESEFIEHTAPALALGLKDILMDQKNEELLYKRNYTAYQEYFFGQLVKLTRENGVRLIYLLPPRYVPGKDLSHFRPMSFKNNPDPSIPYMGILEEKLFSSSDDKELQKYYVNHNHLNTNGNTHFSRTLIWPLKELYDQTSP